MSIDPNGIAWNPQLSKPIAQGRIVPIGVLFWEAGPDTVTVIPMKGQDGHRRGSGDDPQVQ